MIQKLLSFFYKWNAFEKNNGITIVDFDLIQKADKSAPHFISREEVKAELINLLNTWDKSQVSPLYSKLEGSLYYLRALMGETSAFSEYVSKTMGVTPTFISKDAVVEQSEVLKNSYKKLGVNWQKNEIVNFRKSNKLSQKEIETEFTNFRDRVVPEVIHWLGLSLDVNYKVEFVDLDEYWMNWISTDETGNIVLKYNLNRRHTWIKGATEYLVFHEICAHALQTLSWKQQIELGKMHPLFGLITVFTCEQFLLEGIAESLYYFYPENVFTKYGLLNVHTDHLTWMVWNNAHIMANEGKAPAEIIQYCQKYLPYWSAAEIAKGINEKTANPLGRTYQYIYGISLYYHQLLAKKLSVEERRQYVIDIYTHVYTPREIFQKYKILQND